MRTYKEICWFIVMIGMIYAFITIVGDKLPLPLLCVWGFCVGSMFHDLFNKVHPTP